MGIGIVKECHEVKAVCEKYGYGNVMEWASALWRYDYMKKGYDKMLGACFVPTCPDFIKAKFKCEKSHRLYDDLVERILEGETEAQGGEQWLNAQSRRYAPTAHIVMYVSGQKDS